MLSDSRIVLERPSRPVTFTGLMTLYESNYVRLGWLLQDLRDIPAELVSEAPRDLSLHLSLLEQARYTTTFKLTYYFVDADQYVADPDLTIRVYHDARLVEAMSCATRHRHAALKGFATPAGTELRRRWSRNVMLNKWLEYCADAGHRFPAHPRRLT
jgi:uncharacterized protein YqiB (DUF1249 family)